MGLEYLYQPENSNPEVLLLEGSRKSPRAKYPLLEHLMGLPVNAGVYEGFESRFLDTFNNPDPDFTAELLIVGLTKTAKSSLRIELRDRLAQITGLPFYTHDYETAINVGREQGKIVNPSGQVTPAEFAYANVQDNYITDLFLSKVGGRKGVVREFPGITQDPITGAGVTRGDWNFLRNDVYVTDQERKRREIFIVVLGASEGMRRRNMWRWLKALQKRKQQLQPYTGYDVTLGASKQHAQALVEAMWYLIRTREFGDKSHFYKIQSRYELEMRITQRYETVRTIVKRVMKPRIGQAIFGNSRSPQVIYLENKDLPDQKVLDGYLEKRERVDEEFGLLNVLNQLAEESGNLILQRQLEILKPAESQGEE